MASEIGSRVWDLERAIGLLEEERADLRRAEGRVRAAAERVDRIRTETLAAIPSGQGEGLDEFSLKGFRFANLRWDSRTGEWYIGAGMSVRGGIREAMEVARILGTPVDLGSVNGADVTVRPGEDYDTIAKRHQADGGVGS